MNRHRYSVHIPYKYPHESQPFLYQRKSHLIHIPLHSAYSICKDLHLHSGTALALAAALYAVLFGFTGPIVAVFNSENSALMAQYAFSGMRIYFLGYFFAGFNIVAAGYLGAVDRPAEASATSLSRGIVAIVACSLVLSALFGMNGVWAAFPASEAITACLTLFLLKRKKRTK